MEEIFKKIAAIIEDVADIPLDEIEMNSSFIDDLDLSSLELMSIVAKVEKEFSIKVNEKQLLSVETVKDVVEYIAGNK
ncbi:acyl carrier protein [Pseudobutyrivibrio xylanivorans]|uniref:Acyl carrier protein n=1 Tax=Pseudobutyrivibrio xylanivorans DSM 14809 TaxID=1123012 RepID=A0A1M6IE31_PSEXY|nr:acyl carrier protein [Pseudobutyrivibrio xylanivorans]SHJ32717.1 acyl carrier protein [Pseudobutyrivibrio xylanivorans DSM 14809]